MRRGTTYWFRFRVPAKCQAALGLTEIRRSLRTSCYREGRRRAASCFVRFSMLCENAHIMDNATQEEIKTIVANFLVDLLGKSGNAADDTAATKANYAAALMNDVAHRATPAPTSITLSDAVAKYRVEKEEVWATKTKQDAKLVHAWLLEHFGAATPIGAIKKREAASFRAGLRRLQKHSKGRTFVERQTDDAALHIAARTASKYLDFAIAFFTWAAVEAGLIENSPFSGVSILFKIKRSKAAVAATTTALRDIFMSPLFQGHRPGKVWQAGLNVTRGDYYWAFVLQFYFGTRIGEIAQLRVSDIQIDADIPYVHIRTVDDDGNLINGNTLKTISSHRKMPICDDLLALGFLDFVRRRRRKDAYLLPLIAPSRGQSSSSKASKFAARYLTRVGQKNAGKATHWFRHALADALRASGTPEYTLKQILGHAQDEMHAKYGTIEDIGAAKAALDNADWKFDPRAVLLKSKSRWAR